MGETMTQSLLSCPFCGKAGTVFAAGAHCPDHNVGCGDHECAGFGLLVTCQQWNRRSPSPVAAAGEPTKARDEFDSEVIIEGADEELQPLLCVHGYGDEPSTEEGGVALLRCDPQLRPKLLSMFRSANEWAKETMRLHGKGKCVPVASPPSAGWRPTHRHKARGSEYERVGLAILQRAGSTELRDDEMMVVYRDKNGVMWVRAEHEFNDGRFEPLPPPPAPKSTKE